MYVRLAPVAVGGFTGAFAKSSLFVAGVTGEVWVADFAGNAAAPEARRCYQFAAAPIENIGVFEL